MQIKYEFANGEVSVVEVDDEIGAVISDSRRKETNLERKERRHCYSMDGLEYGDKDLYAQFTDITPETLIADKEVQDELYTAFSQLSEMQQRRLLMLASGMSMREIAKQQKVHHSTIEESVEAARKKLKNILKTPRQNG